MDGAPERAKSGLIGAKSGQISCVVVQVPKFKRDNELGNKIDKPKTGKSRKKITAKQREARRANLVQYRESVGGSTATKSGVFTVIRSGGRELPPVPYAGEIREAVSALIDAAVVDLGGADAITSMQKQILESSRLALTIVALGARYLAEQGVVDRRRKPHGLLSVLGTYANIVRLNAAELGLERRAKDAKTLEAKLAEIAESEAHEGNDETEPKN